jgi:hypothetical protein
MDVDYLILADAAAAENGKHYVHGGGWDTIQAASFPAQHPMMGVAIRFRIAWADTNHPREIEVDVLDDDGNSILPAPNAIQMNVGRPPTIPAGEDQVAPLALNFVGVRFERPGHYAVVVRIDGEDRARAPFRVAQASSGALPPAAP